MPDLQTKRIRVAKYGVNKRDNPVDFNGDYTPHMKNFHIVGGDLRKYSGFDAYPTANNSRYILKQAEATVINKVFEFATGDGSLDLMVATSSEIFKYDRSAGNFASVTPGLTVDSCDSGWTDTGAVGNLSMSHGTTRMEGAACVQIDASGTVTADGSKLCYNNFSALDLTGYTHISGWVYNEGVSVNGSLTLVISESADGAKSGDYVEVNLPAINMFADRWTFFSTAVDLSSMNAAVSIALWNNTGTSWTVGDILRIDNISANVPLTASSEYHHRIRVAPAVDTAMFTGANVNGRAIVLTNNVDDLLAYSEAAERFATLVHTFSGFQNCVELVEFYNYFMLCNYTTATKFRQSIEHSGAGDLDDHTSVSSGSYYLSDAVGRLLKVFKVGDELVLFFDKTTMIGNYYGAATKFTFRLLLPDIGLLGIDAACQVGNSIVFVGSDRNVYLYKPDAGFQDIGGQIADDLCDLLTGEAAYDLLLFYDQEARRVYVGVRDASETKYKAYVLNLSGAEPSWEYVEIAEEVQSFVSTRDPEDYFEKADLLGIFVARAKVYRLYNPLTVGGFTEGASDTDISCEYQTEDISINDELEYARFQEFIFTAKSSLANSSVTVEYSIDNGTNWSAVDEALIYLENDEWKTYLCHLDVVSRVIRFRFTNTAKDLQIKNDMFIRFIPEGVEEVD